MPSQGCTICGDSEPFHVHVGKQEPGARRIEEYFTVGRGLTEFEAALLWKMRAKDRRSALEDAEIEVACIAQGLHDGTLEADEAAEQLATLSEQMRGRIKP
jgi:hypothetical protein